MFISSPDTKRPTDTFLLCQGSFAWFTVQNVIIVLLYLILRVGAARQFILCLKQTFLALVTLKLTFFWLASFWKLAEGHYPVTVNSTAWFCFSFGFFFFFWYQPESRWRGDGREKKFVIWECLKLCWCSLWKIHRAFKSPFSQFECWRLRFSLFRLPSYCRRDLALTSVWLQLSR